MIAQGISGYAVSTSVGHNADAEIRLQGYGSGGNPVVGHRRAYFPEAGGMVDTAVVDRYALTESHRIPGPALVEERESTIVVLPGDTVSVSSSGNLIVDIKAGG